MGSKMSIVRNSSSNYPGKEPFVMLRTGKKSVKKHICIVLALTVPTLLLVKGIIESKRRWGA